MPCQAIPRLATTSSTLHQVLEHRRFKIGSLDMRAVDDLINGSGSECKPKSDRLGLADPIEPILRLDLIVALLGQGGEHRVARGDQLVDAQAHCSDLSDH